MATSPLALHVTNQTDLPRLSGEIAMIRRIAWRQQPIGSLLALLLLLLAAGSFLQAAIQGTTSARWLGTSGWQLQEEGKEARLVEFEWNRVDLPARWKRDCWFVSAPTIKSESGKLLAYGLKGREPSVYLSSSDKEGDHTRWLFEVVERTRPRDAKSAGKGSGIKEGPEGFTFRVQAARGEFKSWYLAAEDPPKVREGEGRVKRRLTLVREKKQATVFEYVKTVYHAEHK